MASTVAAPSDEDPHALSPEELRHFIAAGFLEVPPSPLAPPELHAAIAAKVLGCGLQQSGTHRTPYGLGMLDGDAAGNNLLHAAPELRGPALLESPRLHRTLRSLLGDGYRIHPHCRGHLRRQGAHTTMWHVDAYAACLSSPACQRTRQAHMRRP